MADIQIAYVPLLIALGLLYFPRQWMKWGKRVVKSERSSRHGNDFDPSKRREMGDPAVVFADEFKKLRNYVDLLRGAVGSAVIVGTIYTPSCFKLAAGAGPSAGKIILVLKCAILLGATLVQLIRYERRLTLFAPIFFAGGLTFGLCGLPAAGFAFLLVWTVNMALPSATAFLATYAAMIVVFGMLFDGMTNVFVAAAFICLFLPVLISLMTKRPLQLFNRRN